MPLNRKPLRESHLPTFFRAKKVIITTGLIESALNDFWGTNMTKKEIGEKYGVCETTLYRWAAKNKHLQEKFLKKPPEPETLRDHLTEMERLRLINNDALTVIELTLQMVKLRLEDELKARENKIEGTVPIKMNELSVVLSEITPYIMSKKPVITNKKGSERSGDSPAGKVVKGGMFKKAQ